MVIDNNPPHPQIVITLVPGNITNGTAELDEEGMCSGCTPCEQTVAVTIQTALTVGVAYTPEGQPPAVIRGFFQKNEKIEAACAKTAGILVVELTGEPNILDEYSVYHSFDCGNCSD